MNADPGKQNLTTEIRRVQRDQLEFFHPRKSELPVFLCGEVCGSYRSGFHTETSKLIAPEDKSGHAGDHVGAG